MSYGLNTQIYAMKQELEPDAENQFLQSLNNEYFNL